MQITVRLDDDAVAFIDRLIAEGHDKSRASVISRAVRREQRRETAARDALILAGGARDDDVDAFIAHTTDHPIALD